ncbi:hypothetical protein EHQ27_07700 [Leptospira wolffii]|uniref:tetratricopeptide repeat protein n=1 Tax=Leptospira wolffii TaxID=409998 RepID=UPI0010834D1D|nr:hypothetical protein [Leptospira wolffii]TGK64692.1 hypothetical protein EHQ32_00265 [Leptospira wolffii]TGK72780.1 hypothetical protein EHQ27_07700 [Leptospira wolffii]TGK76909.1 hypothetical protein EHQ35_00950 [Leptospira wolffii]TGL26634.1 hypothetical protein EHQ57_18100 [Leptospira wolffii]
MKNRESALAFRLRENIKFFVFYIFILFLYSISLSIHAEEGSKTDPKIEILLSEGKYSEAEKLAISVLEVDPTDSKAEFSLTKAWIGLGKEAKEKKNWKAARAYFEKALAKWPLNSELRKELAELENKTVDRSIRSLAVKWKSEKETLDIIQGIRSELSEIKNSLEKNRTDFDSRPYWIATILLLSSIVLELFVLIRRR